MTWQEDAEVVREAQRDVGTSAPQAATQPVEPGPSTSGVEDAEIIRRSLLRNRIDPEAFAALYRLTAALEAAEERKKAAVQDAGYFRKRMVAAEQRVAELEAALREIRERDPYDLGYAQFVQLIAHRALEKSGA